MCQRPLALTARRLTRKVPDIPRGRDGPAVYATRHHAIRHAKLLAKPVPPAASQPPASAITCVASPLQWPIWGSRLLLPSPGRGIVHHSERPDLLEAAQLSGAPDGRPHRLLPPAQDAADLPPCLLSFEGRGRRGGAFVFRAGTRACRPSRPPSLSQTATNAENMPESAHAAGRLKFSPLLWFRCRQNPPSSQSGRGLCCCRARVERRARRGTAAPTQRSVASEQQYVA